MDLPAVRAVALMAAMFLDAQRDVEHIDLLHDIRPKAGGLQAVPALGAKLQAMVEGVNQFRREQSSFVLGVAGLPTGGTRHLLVRSTRFGRFDDVRRGRFGGGGRVLVGGSELLLESGYIGALRCQFLL